MQEIKTPPEVDMETFNKLANEVAQSVLTLLTAKEATSVFVDIRKAVMSGGLQGALNYLIMNTDDDMASIKADLIAAMDVLLPQLIGGRDGRRAQDMKTFGTA